MKQTVLVVDGSRAARKMLELKLKKHEVEVIHAASANQALAKLHRYPVSVITTAYALPDEDCSKFIAEVRNTPGFENTPVIVVSGDELDASAFDAELKVARIFPKSLGIAHLTEEIMETLAESPEVSQILRDFMPII